MNVVERECSASDRLDTRREAEVSVVWGAGPLTVRRRRRGGEHPWALLVVLFACVRQPAELLPLLQMELQRKPPASAVAEQGCFIDRKHTLPETATSRKEASSGSTLAYAHYTLSLMPCLSTPYPPFFLAEKKPRRRAATLPVRSGGACGRA